jgi:hypothetical protein
LKVEAPKTSQSLGPRWSRALLPKLKQKSADEQHQSGKDWRPHDAR